jgi:hypothetical protein
VWPGSLSRVTAVEPSLSMMRLGERLEAARRFAHPSAPVVRHMSVQHALKITCCHIVMLLWCLVAGPCHWACCIHIVAARRFAHPSAPVVRHVYIQHALTFTQLHTPLLMPLPLWMHELLLQLLAARGLHTTKRKASTSGDICRFLLLLLLLLPGALALCAPPCAAGPACPQQPGRCSQG